MIVLEPYLPASGPAPRVLVTFKAFEVLAQSFYSIFYKALNVPLISYPIKQIGFNELGQLITLSRL